jgi:hypothetical protein
MHLSTPFLLVSLLFTSTLASSSARTDTSFNFGAGPTSTSTEDFNFGTTNTGFDFSISTTITILDGFTVTTSGYSIGKTPEPKGEWTLDIHPHNTECLFGTNSVCPFCHYAKHSPSLL